METFGTPGAIRAWSEAARHRGERVGVVPTMGSLHAGHVALIEAARAGADRVVVTIFVNPLQFNEASDFDAYPRPIDDDLVTCERLGVDAVYAPTGAIMYPAGYQTHVEPGDLADRLEGPMRPGHFRGVSTVVTKLFGATRPHLATFGRKDFQQLAIVRRMVADLDMGVEIVDIPIQREPDGLAMSSRNVRLAPDDRAAAVVLSQALLAAGEAHAGGIRHADVLRRKVSDAINAERRARLEYVELVDADTLAPLEHVDVPAALLVAAWFGDVRLIDNLQLP